MTSSKCNSIQGYNFRLNFKVIQQFWVKEPHPSATLFSVLTFASTLKSFNSFEMDAEIVCSYLFDSDV